jgi:hypothetical protein
MGPKKIALWFLIASVGASAVLGIVIVLAGSLSDLQVRIILTTLTISAASICALACGALWEIRRKMLLPLGGALLASVTAVLFIIGIWARVSGDEFWKVAASAGLLAVATAHACLLGLARLAQRFVWTRAIAFVAVYVLAALFIYLIYFTPKGDIFVRIIGATSIIVAALSILTPLFHRLSRGDLSTSGPTPSKAEPRLFTIVTCPQCGSVLPNSLAPIKCVTCGCRFVITILGDESTWTLVQGH